MKHWAIGVLLVFICCLSISCADIADDGNLNTPSPRITWLDGIVCIEDNAIISNGVTLYASDGELSLLHTNENPVRQLQYYGGELYYSDENGIWRLSDEPERICGLCARGGESGRLQMFTCDFVIHSGRLYYDIDDLTVYRELE